MLPFASVGMAYYMYSTGSGSFDGRVWQGRRLRAQQNAGPRRGQEVSLPNRSRGGKGVDDSKHSREALPPGAAADSREHPLLVYLASVRFHQDGRPGHLIYASPTDCSVDGHGRVGLDRTTEDTVI